MRRDLTDFFLVEDHQLAIHARLENWSRWVSVHRVSWEHPMWKQGKPNGRQWHAPELKVPVDQLDGMRMEKAVGQLPEKHRAALRWHYVFRSAPAHARRALGLTNEGLMKHVRDGRQMLANRL